MSLSKRLIRNITNVILDGKSLDIDGVAAVALYGAVVSITPESKVKMENSRRMVEEMISYGKVVYGVTTGFGKFSNVSIDQKDTEILQENLIISHAVGVGKPLDEKIVRAIMLIRVNSLSQGFSGIRYETVETLVEMLNKGVHPVIPEKGSLGASGDLAPLAHMVLVMIGKGEAFYQGTRMLGKEAMDLAGISTICLEAKEGLALINGTQVMTGIGALVFHEAEELAKTADIAGAMTVEALEGLSIAFDAKVHQVRPHIGQALVADNLRRLLAESQILASAKHGRVQDAYSLRCIPQVHGASRDALDYVKKILEIEINSVTDNPILFPLTGEVISGGNFHGQPVALALDFLGIALAELASISERRIERLVNPALNRGLPAFLIDNGGLNSGYMIAQYVAAALVSENKVLAHPACVDSIPSSANQEDHVSMGTIGARKAKEILDNLRNVLAIELICAAQGMDLRGGQPARGTGAAYNAIRKEVDFLQKDREIRFDVEKIYEMLKLGTIIDEVSESLGFIG